MTTADDPRLRFEVEQFLYAEAACLDAHDYPGWLTLFTPDALYWIPSGADDIDPTREVSIVHDRLGFLTERVWRFDSGLAYAQEPRSRTAHLVSNIRVLDVTAHEAGGEAIQVDACFIVAEFRRNNRYQHAGRYDYRLHRHGGEIRIDRKKVDLIDNDGLLGNLSLLI